MFAILLLVVSKITSAQNGISNYKVNFADAVYNNRNILIIRSFNQSEKLYYLTVDLNNLETEIIEAGQLSVHKLSWQQVMRFYSNTPYVKAIKIALSKSYSLQNSGLIHGYPKEKGITLTIDLCPSHKPLDRVIFTSLISEFNKTERPVPLALSVTGRFMINHPDDLLWLKSLIASGDISITWINHSYNHFYNPKAPLQDNFLLKSGTDISFEILETEKEMIKCRFLPSVFFRFPGLVSDHKIVESVVEYGLIPIGCDAWLAKGDQVHSGSIVLIHGNGNEPLGVKDFIHLLQNEKSFVLNKEWLLYDLRESVDNEVLSGKS